MKCRHCRVEYHPNWQYLTVGNDRSGGHQIAAAQCPACGKYNIQHLQGHLTPRMQISAITATTFVYPLSMAREPLHESVTGVFETDYVEACNTLEASPKASAALSRRLLQHILRECAGIKERDLNQEIQTALDKKIYPGHIADSLDAIRTLGNFAAHPIKSTSTGEIVEVEEGEAEWTLDTVEALFDFHFVQPAKLKAKRDALDKKLADAGKPPLKT